MLDIRSLFSVPKVLVSTAASSRIWTLRKRPVIPCCWVAIAAHQSSQGAPPNLLSPQLVPKYNPPGLGEGQSLQNNPGETHISGELVRQFLSRRVKLPRLSRLLSLSSLCLLLWSRVVTPGVFCSCWDRCSMLLYTWSNGMKEKKKKEMGWANLMRNISGKHRIRPSHNRIQIQLHSQDRNKNRLPNTRNNDGPSHPPVGQFCHFPVFHA